MGSKERKLIPLVSVSLEELVPPDDFYRHLDRVLVLGFVRDLVRDCYRAGGRPSSDPVVFFKLQLIMFFEGIRSERQLMRVVTDRLSLRWYVGYDLTEPVPDHSGLTRIRERYGVEMFQRFFALLAGTQREVIDRPLKWHDPSIEQFTRGDELPAEVVNEKDPAISLELVRCLVDFTLVVPLQVEADQAEFAPARTIGCREWTQRASYCKGSPLSVPSNAR